MKQSLGRQAIKESQTPVIFRPSYRGDPHMEKPSRKGAGRGRGEGDAYQDWGSLGQGAVRR